jgi:hypothetical protein
LSLRRQENTYPLSQEEKMTSKQNTNLKIILPIVVVLVILLILVLLASGACNAPAGTQGLLPGSTGTATALSNLNLRSGPGTNYSVVGRLSEGDTVKIIGRNEDSSWLQVESEAGTAWITADPSLVKIEGQELSALPVVEAPPLSYNPSNPMVNMVLNQIPLVLHNPQSFTCASHAGTNNLNLISLAESNVIGPHAGDFVYKGDNVLFKYIGGSLYLIKENPIARFEGGAETLPFDKAMQAFQNGDIVWTGQLGQSPGRGVTGCDPTVK